jgi:signal transduction histidine kinase
VRHAIIDLATETAPKLASTPNVSFSGPVDLVVTGALADDVVAVVRESLTNVIKHANATQTAVEIAVTGDDLTVRITDNGTGSTSTRRSGVANLDERALRRGGHFDFSSSATGTTVTWTVPIEVAP